MASISMIIKSKKNKSGGSILVSEANDRFDPACVRLFDLGFFSHFYDQGFIARLRRPKDNPGLVFQRTPSENAMACHRFKNKLVKKV